jgi:hypothetical protein
LQVKEEEVDCQSNLSMASLFWKRKNRQNDLFSPHNCLPFSLLEERLPIYYVCFVDTRFGNNLTDVDAPSYSKKTEVIVPLDSKSGRVSFPSGLGSSSRDSSWAAVAKSIQGNLMTVYITPGPNAIVSEWKMRIETREAGIPLTYYVETKIYILFNPWNKSE